MMKFKAHKYLIFTVIFFGLIYSLISIVNHYNFRTYALDLGLYTNALYKYAHLQLADSSMIKEGHEYLLGGHFDLYLILFSPLVYIFRTYTLLIVQIASILAGGIGVYKYYKLSGSKQEFIALAATIYFLLFFGIYSALAFDYHSNVIAAMLIPWFFYFFKRKYFGIASVLVLFVLISQENMALWMIFICIGLIFEYRKNKSAVTYLSLFILASIIYFITVIYVLIPRFSNSNEYTGFAYSILGNTPLEALKNLLTHPVDHLKILFINHNNIPGGDYVKIEMHVLVLLSGALILILRPYYLIMLIPIYFQKLYHDSFLMWGIGGQYSIEFAPILALGVFSVIKDFKNSRTVKIVTALVLLGAFASTIRVMDHTVFYTDKSRIRIYQAIHYKRNYDVIQVHKILDKIPANAKVSAQTPFVPHLSLRDKIYQFPIVNDAEYMVYSEKEGKYPLDKETFNVTIKCMLNSGDWEIMFKSEDLVILKKTND
jgi:uncharacterized membrane protein